MPTTPTRDRVTFTRGERRGWHRQDEHGRAHAASGSDLSPIHLTYPRGYDPACGWCWLGAPHTEAAHAQEVEA